MKAPSSLIGAYEPRKVVSVALNTDQVAELKRYTENEVFALKNHIASAVEANWQGDLSAPALVRKLRAAEALQLALARALRESKPQPVDSRKHGSDLYELYDDTDEDGTSWTVQINEGDEETFETEKAARTYLALGAERYSAVTRKLAGMGKVELADAVQLERASGNFYAADLYAAELAGRS